MSIAMAAALLTVAPAQASPPSTPIAKLPADERTKLAQEATAADDEMQTAFDEMVAATARLDARRGVSANGSNNTLNPKSAQAAFLKAAQGWLAYSFLGCRFAGSLAVAGGEPNVAEIRCHVASSRARVTELRQQLQSIAAP